MVPTRTAESRCLQHSHLIEEELPALLLPQVHHFHSHLAPRVLLPSDAHNSCGAFPNLDVIFQQCPGISLVHNHPEGSFELLVSHNHRVLTGWLPLPSRVLGQVEVAGTGLGLPVPGGPCWGGPAWGHCHSLLCCWGLLGGPSFGDHPGELGGRLVWGQRLGFGCRAVGGTPLLGLVESIRLQEEQRGKTK